MLISFDPEAMSLYIQIKDAKVKRTIEVAPETFIDLDADGDLIGVEMLRPGHLTILKKIAVKYNSPNLKNIPLEYLPKAFAHAA